MEVTFLGVGRAARALRDVDPAVRRIAVLELLEVTDEDAVAPLLISALQDLDATVRADAARGLEGFERDDAVAALTLLLFDEDVDVREAAAATLAELKDPALGIHLLPLATATEDFVRASALRALRPLRRAESFGPAVAALHARDAGVRREAVAVLGYLQDEAALAPLSAVAESDGDPDVRRAAAGALSFSPDARVIDSLCSALRDRAWQVREEAAATLGRLGFDEAVAPLIDALDDDYWQVRLRAAGALGKLRARQAVPALCAALVHPMSNLRKEAALALGQIGDGAAVPSLRAALEDPDPDVRKFAILALERIGAPSSGGA